MPIFFIIILIVGVIIVIFSLKIAFSFLSKSDSNFEKNINEKNPSRAKYTILAHKEEISKMEIKIKNFENEINKRK